MVYNFNDFLSEYSSEYFAIKSTLNYMLTYPESLIKLDLDIIDPDLLDNHQKDWIRLVSQFEGMEKNFFKPYWVPITADSLNTFMDPSDKDFPLFKSHYFFLKPNHYYKEFLFYKITDLLSEIDSGIDFDWLEAHRLAGIFNRLAIVNEMRNALKI